MARLSSLIVLVVFGLAGTVQAQVPAEVKRALAARDYDTAIAWLAPNAQSGDPDAAYELGKLYRLGKGVDADRSAAAEMFAIAAEAGNPDAQPLLALHQEANGDLDAATGLMQQAADSGHAKAQRWLAGSRHTADERSLFDRIVSRAPVSGHISTAELAAVDDQPMTPLMVAVRTGSAAWTRALLAAGADPDVRDPLGNTALHFAVSAENPELTTLLLNANASTSLRTAGGSTALHLATASGNVAITRALLDAGADRQMRGEGGWSASQLAARSNDVRLRTLFGLQHEVPGTARNTASTLQRQLARAARDADAREIEALIKAGASPDQPDASGEPAVSLAVRAGHLAAVQQLMKHARESDVLPQAVLAAAGADQPEILQWLLTRQTQSSGEQNLHSAALLAAVGSDCAACIPPLLQAGADPDVSSPGGDTALLLAVKKNHPASAIALAAESHQLDSADSNARTALWWAGKFGQTDVCQLLLQRGADLKADEDGLTVLHIAAVEDRAKVVKLLAGRMDIDTATPSGNSALILAAGRGALAAANALLESGAELERRNNSGNTALIVATQAQAFDVASMLISAGASPTTRNKQFESARSIAVNSGDERWQNLLAKNSENGLLSLFN